MKTLVLQCESARLLGTLVDTDSGRVINEVVVDDVLESEAAFRQILERLGTAVESIAVVAHRVPREGTRPYGTVAIDDAFEEQMAALPSLSREFQPSCLGTIRAARKLLPKASSIAVFNTATLIARAATEFALREPAANEAETVPIAISARHVHLTVETIEALFGRGYELQPYRPLSQPGQYAAQETLTIVGPKGRIENVRVLGPPREANQVEISRTDEFHLGIDAPVRASGDIAGTPGITLISPTASVVIEQGLICAQRHVHMTPADAARWRVSDGEMVDIAVDTEGRDLEFRDVLIRVSPNYKLEMHIDTDEANAADLNPGDAGVLTATEKPGKLLRRKHTAS